MSNEKNGALYTTGHTRPVYGRFISLPKMMKETDIEAGPLPFSAAAPRTRTCINV